MLINFFCTNRHIELNLTLNSLLINICSDKRGDTLQRKGWNSVGKKLLCLTNMNMFIWHIIFTCVDLDSWYWVVIGQKES